MNEMMNHRSFLGVLAASLLAGGVSACGGSEPAPIAPEPAPVADAPRKSGPTPQVRQELGSIDQRKVEQTFQTLQGPLETCHKQGRERVDVLAGDVKVFLRIDGAGKMRYGYFEESTIGDRATEKCILDVFGRASWPKPEGGEAEVRNGFGWSPGGEREPTAWSSDKVTTALVEATAVRKDVDKCKSGVTGDFHVTGYVEEGDHDADKDDKKPEPAAAKRGKDSKPAKKPADKPKSAAKADPKEKEKIGKFRSLGVSAPSKEAAEKVDCVVDALKALELPTPGSYAAKVTFTL